MLADSKAFSGYSVDDLDKAQAFYEDTLGLSVDRADEMQIMRVRFAGDRHVIVYARWTSRDPAGNVLSVVQEEG